MEVFNMKRRIWLLTLVIVLIGIFAIAFAQFNSGETSIYSQIKLMNKVLTVIYSEYVDPIDYRKLIKGAIDGMTSTLDPHTVFFTPKQYEELKIDTRGSFGGLGIQISVRDKWLTVISPMEGTPAWRAGLQAGDKIIKIDGKSTKGITVTQAVTKLRGEPGSQVTITIEREGEPKPFDVTITRDIIEIKPVPFYGLTENGVGYIRLVGFSSDAGDAVKKALEDLEAQGAKGIILDLRGNPGGLLNQAVSVASQFLETDALVVYTKGRTTFQSREFYTNEVGVYPEGALIVLVNGGSASASEIVSGAIQDHDRGIIMGTKTFGKGLVQSVRPLSDGTALKITTAKYYIPSGRCIQREYYLKRRESAIITDTLNWHPDELDPWNFEPEAADTDTTEEKPIYYTTGGRTVYGGGGITPDVEYKLPKLNKLEIELERKGLFFAFVVHYSAEHKNAISSPDFVVTDAMLQEFRAFLEKKEFEYQTRAEEILDQVDSIAGEDSLSEETMQALEQFRKQLQKEQEREFEQSHEYIVRAIRREIISKNWGEQERYRQIVLGTDPEIKKAEEIILDREEYSNYLKADKK